MNSSINVITNALEYYDINREKYNKIVSKIKYYSLNKTDSDIGHNSILFYDKNKKLIFESRYETIGVYNVLSSTWIWAWSVPTFNKNVTYISKKILNYGLDIPPEPENKFLKSELITSRFRISDTIQLDLHVSIASYISKNPFIYKHIHKNIQINPNINNPEKQIYPITDVNSADDDYVIMYLYLLDTPDTINK